MTLNGRRSEVFFELVFCTGSHIYIFEVYEASLHELKKQETLALIDILTLHSKNSHLDVVLSMNFVVTCFEI